MKNTLKALFISLGLISASLLQAGDALESLSIEDEKAYLDIYKICNEIIKELTEQIELAEQTEDGTSNPYEVESFCSFRKRALETFMAKEIDVSRIDIPEECPTLPYRFMLKSLNEDISYYEFRRQVLEASGADEKL